MNKKKIRIMTALAVYDKGAGRRDKKADGYYKMDYIYKRNAGTRLGVFFGALTLYFFRVMNLVLENNLESLLMDLKTEIFGFAIFTGILLLAYTALGTFVTAREYNGASRRLKNYYALLDRLAEIEEVEKAGKIGQNYKLN